MRDIPDVSLSAAPHEGLRALRGRLLCAQMLEGEFNLLRGGRYVGFDSVVCRHHGAGRSQQSSTIHLQAHDKARPTMFSIASLLRRRLTRHSVTARVQPPLWPTSCIFHDVTVGNNAVPGEINYGLATAQYQAGAGYDMATGLGSVNITNLVDQWSSVTFTGTTTTLALTS